jgi:transcriptional regulator with XRE-family HTH domain
MNAILAKNIRRLRDIKHWTQQHLADTAGIQLRTVQRVETLGALANAFDMSIDLLQTDFEAVVDRMEREAEEFKKTHHIINVTQITASAHLASFGEVHGGIYHCNSEDDGVQDAFAQLRAEMHDCIDIWGDVDATAQRDFARSIFERVEAMNDLGFAIVTGKSQEKWHGMDVTILYVVAMPKDQVKEFIAIERVPTKAATG